MELFLNLKLGWWFCFGCCSAGSDIRSPYNDSCDSIEELVHRVCACWCRGDQQLASDPRLNCSYFERNTCVGFFTCYIYMMVLLLYHARVYAQLFAAVVIVSSQWLYLISMGCSIDLVLMSAECWMTYSPICPVESEVVQYFILFYWHIGSYIAYMDPTIQTFSTSDTMLGGFLLCFLKGSDSIRFGRDSRPRDPGILHMNCKRQLSRLQSSDS